MNETEFNTENDEGIIAEEMSSSDSGSKGSKDSKAPSRFCRNFWAKNKCFVGQQCKFIHETFEALSSSETRITITRSLPPSGGICFPFKDSGKCEKVDSGTVCPFLHWKPSGCADNEGTRSAMEEGGLGGARGALKSVRFSTENAEEEKDTSSSKEQISQMKSMGMSDAQIRAAMDAKTRKKDSISSEEQISKMKSMGMSDTQIRAAMNAKTTSNDEIGPVPGQISRIGSRGDYGFIDVGKAQEVYFKSSFCYSGYERGHCVLVTYRSFPADSSSSGKAGKAGRRGGGPSLVATDVTRDFKMEGLRKASEDLLRLTDGSLYVDPRELDERSAAELLTKVSELTKQERLRRSKQIQKNMKILKNASSAQVVFMLDCTGSMQSYIDECKNKIVDLQRKLLSQLSNSEIEFAFVGYRDFDTSNPPVLDFTLDADKFSSHVGTYGKAEGGGDECEDVHGGLNNVAKLSWKAQIGSKILFHIADAPCHGKYFAGNKRYSDNYPNVDPDGREAQALLKNLCVNNCVIYNFLEINNRTDDMIATFNKLMKGFSSQAKPICKQPIKDATEIIDLAFASTLDTIRASYSSATLSLKSEEKKAGTKESLFRKIMEAADTARKTARKTARMSTLTAIREGGSEDGSTERKSRERSPSSCAVGSYFAQLDTFKPHFCSSGDSSADPAQQVFRFSYDLPCVLARYVEDDSATKGEESETPTLDDLPNLLRSPLQPSKKTHKSKFVIEKKQFDAGNVRVVHKAHDVTYDEAQHYVCKLHKEFDSQSDDLRAVQQDLQVQGVAALMARLFSKQKPITKPVKYLKSWGIKMVSPSTGEVRYGSLERVVKEDFKKWCSNAGWSNPDEYSATLAAFSHWTYHASNGYLMVVDIQGITSTASGEESFLLTDPAIHCIAFERFGGTNLGKEGMEAFFISHVCNDICEAMGMKKHALHPKNKSKPLGTRAI